MLVNQIIDELINLSIPHFIKQLLLTALKDKLILVLLREGEESSSGERLLVRQPVLRKWHAEMVWETDSKQKIESLHHTDLIMNELGYSVNDKPMCCWTLKTMFFLAVMDEKMRRKSKSLMFHPLKEKNSHFWK